MTDWVRTPGELAALADSLRGCRALALDTESDSLYHYFEKVCLIQIAGEGVAVLVDPLALSDLSPLAPVLVDPGVVKVMHGADYDVTSIKRDFGFRIGNLFDTMIAARFLGLPAVGLQALAQAELGVVLSKASQLDDWSRRPLTPAQERYALEDVRHLLPLHRRLEEKLREAGRLEWVKEECAAVAALEPAPRRRDPLAWQKVKGARALSRRQQAALRAVFEWREQRAEATNRPPFKVLGAEALITLAQRHPRNRAELSRVRGVLPRLEDQAPHILEALRRAEAQAEGELPLIAPSPRPPLPSDEVRRQADSLRAWRSRTALRLGLDVSIVLPQRLIERVIEAAPHDRADLAAISGLRRWRLASFGDEILAAIARQSL